MVDSFVSGVGPLFGPDFVVVTVPDDNGVPFGVQVYPDAHNPELRQAGLPTQYYFQPARVYLAKKQDSPQDFDFEMTVFKGLMTDESSITPAEMAGASSELGGGFCTFSTTFAISDNMIAGVLDKLKQRDHSAPNPRLAQYFNYQQHDPDPVLGIVPITNSAVVCAVQDPEATGGLVKMTAQYSGKGSIEQHGFCTFLVSCNLPAAGEIAGALKAGASPPFTVDNTLTESFYINGVTVHVDVDVDKVYDSFSAAISTGGFLGINSLSASYAYSNCQTTGGITTHITENGTVLDDATKKWVDDNVDAMKKTAMDLVQHEIFDWDPSKTDSQASTDRGWFSEVFGGSSVSLKSTHEKRGVHFTQDLILDETITVSQTVSGDLNDLLPAVRADLNKYLFIVDVGEFFKKLQVAAYCTVVWDEKLQDGTNLADPIQAVQLEVSYPDFSSLPNAPLNLVTLAQGSHYIPGQSAPKGPVSPAVWTRDNGKDYVNVAFLRLDNAIPGWPQDQVTLKRKLVFDGQDPRVNLSSAIAPNDPGVAELEETGTDHAPVMTADAVGYVFVRFLVHPQNIPPNCTVIITPTIGADTYPPITVTSANKMNAIWEVFSDKYIQESEFSYTMSVEFDGPNFTDPSVTVTTPTPVKVSIPKGIAKYINPLTAPIPDIPQDQIAIVNGYVKAALNPSP